MMAFSSSIFSTAQRWSAFLIPSQRPPGRIVVARCRVQTWITDLYHLGVLRIRANVTEDLGVAVDAAFGFRAIQRRQRAIHPWWALLSS